MSDSMSFDFTELDRLAADLAEVPKNAGPFIQKAVEIGARNVRDTWRSSARGLRHAPSYPGSITYDMVGYRGFGVSIIQADIGPDKERPQGALGNLIEGGSPTSAPHNFGTSALQAEQEDFITGIVTAEADARKKSGL